MTTRRDFLKKAGYAAPTIMTLTAMPSYAGAGSNRPDKKKKKKKDKRKERKAKRKKR